MAELTPPKEPVYILPLTLMVRDVTATALHIEIAAVIHDAAGQSVQSLPVTVDGKTSPEECSQILQATISQIAQTLAKRGEALVPEPAAPEPDALESLNGRVFYGSVSR